MASTSDDDASCRKMIKTCNNDGPAPWSDLNHDLLLLVMVRLGVFDFLSFNGLCKSWRSVALSNRKLFMASRPPMSMWISAEDNKKTYCNLMDFEGRHFKIIFPNSVGRACVGVTCGHLIFFRTKTRDFWLVNLITRHELHFPCAPIYAKLLPSIKAILVFSPSLSGWLFVMLDGFSRRIWFSISGKGAWNHVSTTFPILHLHVFNGKIYTITSKYNTLEVGHLYEMRLDPEPKLTLVEAKNYPKLCSKTEFVSYGENLYLILYVSADSYKVHQLDFGEMKWVCREKIKEEYVFFISYLNQSAAVKRESGGLALIEINQAGSIGNTCGISPMNV